jgi:hypothetical protein
MKKFYDANSILLWGYPKAIKWDFFLVSLRGVLYERLGAVSVNAVAACLSGCLIYLVFPKRSMPRFFVERERTIKFFAVVSLAAIAVTALLQKQVYYYYVTSFAPFLIFPMCIGLGVLAYLLIDALKTVRPSGIGGPAALVLCSALLAFVVTDKIVLKNYSQITEDMPVRSLPAYDALAKYKGKSFVTNYMPHYTSYFTGEWSNMVLAVPAYYYENFAGNMTGYITNSEYLFERDKFVNRQKYENPDLVFIADIPPFPHVKNPELAFFRYPLVEKGDRFWIFDARPRRAPQKPDDPAGRVN